MRHEAATLLQSAIRRRQASTRFRHKAALFRGKLKENLVRRIQARWRGFACRRHMRQIKRDLKRELAWLSARRMQAAWRGSVARRRCRAIRARNAQRRQEASVRVVQARVRGFLARSWWSAARARDGVGGERSSKAAASVFTAKVALSKERKDQAAVEATCVVEETQAAVAMVQAQIGISTTERAVDDERAAAIRRAKKEQQSAAAGMLAAAQSERRAEVERDRIRVERQASLEEDAAILLQCSWRGRLARRRFSELKRARDRRLAAAAGVVAGRPRGKRVRSIGSRVLQVREEERPQRRRHGRRRERRPRQRR